MININIKLNKLKTIFNKHANPAAITNCVKANGGAKNIIKISAIPSITSIRQLENIQMKIKKKNRTNSHTTRLATIDGNVNDIGLMF